MNEFSKLKATGDSIVDIIHYKDGRVEEIDRGHNLVVNSLLPLLQCLLKNDSSYKGISTGRLEVEVTLGMTARLVLS